MPNRSRKASDDPNETAFRIVASVTGEKPAQPKKRKPRKKNPAAVALGRLGGKKGGPARAKKLSEARRKAIAKKAAKARWAKREK